MGKVKNENAGVFTSKGLFILLHMANEGHVVLYLTSECSFKTSMIGAICASVIPRIRTRVPVKCPSQPIMCVISHKQRNDRKWMWRLMQSQAT